MNEQQSKSDVPQVIFHDVICVVFEIPKCRETQVKVNYHGTVDGKIFDSSIDKEWLKTQKRKAEPIVFKARPFRIEAARALV